MTDTMVTPEPALVKTAPAQWVVIDPAEQAAVRRLAGRVYAELSRRLNSGSPFQTPAGAWNGEESLDTEDQVAASIGISGQSAIYVRFSTRSLDFGRLAIAKRLGKGCYEVYLSEAGFFAWIERLAPPPKTPAELVALELERAHPELAARIERALALVKEGQTEFPHYDTGAELTTREPTRHCNCKDAQFRAPWVDGIGVACKHTLAQLISERVATDTYNAGARKRIDKQQRRQALPAWAGRNESIESWL